MCNIDNRTYLLWVTTMFHTMFFLAILLAPLVNSNYVLMLHAIFVPFILAHWFSGDNTCAVTLVERGFRRMRDGDEYDDNDCVSCKVIEPVFDFPKYFPKIYKYIVMIGIVLWSITMMKLVGKWQNGNIKSWRDLFRI